MAAQISETKQQIAANKVIDRKEQVKLLAHQMGTQKLQIAKQTREARKAMEAEKKSAGVSKESLVMQQKRFEELANSHKLKNYEILKNLHRNRFNRLVELNKKKETIEQKQARAQANRDKITQKKVQSAKDSYTVYKLPLIKVVPVK